MSEEFMSAVNSEATESTETAVDMGNATTEEQVTPQATTESIVQETPQERQERLFRQEEVNRIVQERLAREKQRFEQELKNNPHLSYLEEKARRFGLTVEQLIENDRKWEEQQRLNELIQKNIPEEYARKLLKVDELEKWKQQTEQERQAEIQRKQQEQVRRQMYEEFFELYPEFSRDPEKVKEIPAEVWQMVERGHRLASAYALWENKQLKQQQQTQQANLKNAESSTGSIKTVGNTGGYISREQFEANKHNINWVRKNLKLIEESRKHWK